MTWQGIAWVALINVAGLGVIALLTVRYMGRMADDQRAHSQRLEQLLIEMQSTITDRLLDALIARLNGHARALLNEPTEPKG